MTEPTITDVASGRALQTLPVGFVFEAIEGAGIRHALLRGYDELLHPTEKLEVDLLVHPQDIESLAMTLAKLGFVETPAWGHAPHRFFISYSTELGFWLKLDVVTALYYGAPYRHLKLNLSEVCLHQRIRDGIFVLSQEHEFLTTLLHCVLDKGRFDEKHRVRLQQLASLMQEEPRLRARLGNFVHQYLAPSVAWPFVLEAVGGGNWAALLELRNGLADRLARSEPVATMIKKVATAITRKLRPVFFALGRHGVSAVLLAPDGAGKSTLAASLTKDRILRAHLVYMGTNIEALNVKLPTTPYLMEKIRSVRKRGKRKTLYGTCIRILNLVNSLVDQWYRFLYARYHLLRGHFVVFDRFIYDSWIQKRKASVWKRVRRLIFNFACPTPDLVILLDAPGEVLYRRKQEHPPEWIDRQRAGYHELQGTLTQMVVVDASQTADEVRSEVTDLIWKKYSSRVNPNLNGRSSRTAREGSGR